jgi:hypothetical protein
MVRDVMSKINKCIECDKEILAENPNYKLPETSFMHPKHPINQPDHD